MSVNYMRFTDFNYLGVPFGSGFPLQVLALPIAIGSAVGFSLQSLTQPIS